MFRCPDKEPVDFIPPLELSLPGSTLLLHVLLTEAELPGNVMHHEKLLNGPTLTDAFPIAFKNGYRIHTLLFWCPVCKATAPLSKVHGYVSRFIEAVADVTAATRCRCGEITTYRIRLRNDRSFSYLDGSRWIDKTTVKSSGQKFFGSLKTRFLLLLLRWKSYRLRVHVKNLHEELKKVQNTG